MLSARRLLGFRGHTLGLPDGTLPVDRPTDIDRVIVDRLPQSLYRTARAGVDWVSALTLLVVFAPALVAIATAICLDSPGSPVFRQKRVGKHGKPFTILKFRTLHSVAPTYSLKVDDQSPMVTRVGRFLRRSGLDELPQLWNILRGDMAIIGPRPEQLELIGLYEPWQYQRFLVKPGITGWWQIHHRDGVPLHLNVEKDLYYIQRQGPKIDWLIIRGTSKIALGAFSEVVARRSLVASTHERQAETPDQ